MTREYIDDFAKLIEQLSRFTTYVQHMNGQPGFISFRESTGFLGREEDFKSRVAEDARKALRYKEWEESWIGTGKIAYYSVKAMNKADNLVDGNQQTHFRNRLNPNHPEYKPDAERVLFDIYRNPLCEESEAFSNAIKIFGAKYDIMSFLFFIKYDTRFLPIRPDHFDKSFSILNIDYSTSHKCSWNNYQGFNEIIGKIRNVMEDVLPMEGTPRLIDAHSFVWVIQEDKFINWIPSTEQSAEIEQIAEEKIQRAVTGTGGRRTNNSSVYARSAKVVKETRKRANGICQYCNEPAPFDDKKGNPYLEVHHVIWLSRDGEDSTDNTVALCPNCHTRMHVLDEPEDIKKLLYVINLKK